MPRPLNSRTLSGFYPTEPTAEQVIAARAVLRSRAAWFEHQMETETFESVGAQINAVYQFNLAVSGLEALGDTY